MAPVLYPHTNIQPTYNHILPLSHKSTGLWALDGLGIPRLTIIQQLGSLESQRAEKPGGKKYKIGVGFQYYIHVKIYPTLALFLEFFMIILF